MPALIGTLIEVALFAGVDLHQNLPSLSERQDSMHLSAHPDDPGDLIGVTHQNHRVQLIDQPLVLDSSSTVLSRDEDLTSPDRPIAPLAVVRYNSLRALTSRPLPSGMRNTSS